MPYVLRGEFTGEREGAQLRINRLDIKPQSSLPRAQLWTILLLCKDMESFELLHAPQFLE